MSGLNLEIEKSKAILARERMAVLGIRVERSAPCAELSPFVNHYWSVEWCLAPGVEHAQAVLLHPCVGLAVEKDKTHIYGVITKKSTQRLSDQGIVFAAQFRPGGFYPFFQQPVHKLTNRQVALETIFGPNDLEQALLQRSTYSERQAALEAFLLAHKPGRDAQAELAGEIVETIAASQTIVRVRDVSLHSGLSQRSLQRLFRDYVGVSPKWVIQRYRLHEAADQLAQGHFETLADLAQTLGYFDQAHFVRDFKQVVGLTPGAYLQGLKDHQRS